MTVAPATQRHVMVTGGRGYADRARVFSALDQLHVLLPVTLLHHGGAHGADSLGEDWAMARQVPVVEHHADWAKWGRSAGPIRNETMLKAAIERARATDGADLVVVAFPGGIGTQDAVRRCRGKNVTVIEVVDNNQISMPWGRS